MLGSFSKYTSLSLTPTLERFYGSLPSVYKQYPVSGFFFLVFLCGGGGGGGVEPSPSQYAAWWVVNKRKSLHYVVLLWDTFHVGNNFVWD